MSLQNRPNDAGYLFQVLGSHQVRHLSTVEDVVDVLYTEPAAVALVAAVSIDCSVASKLLKDMLCGPDN